ncbi:MAG: DUF2490 domain-containing protein [Chitinophagales bacterium]|nr:DUF2490 domain-containing protein [Chitinophagales bacterium]MDW8427295.1 DUF2490 domain-containing protein [Chitinophagales bacterium]
MCGLSIGLISPKLSQAQKNITHKQMIWYGLFTTLKFSPTLYYQHEFQERHDINPFEQYQFLIRGHLHYVLGKSGWEASAGSSLFLHEQHNEASATRYTIPELRPHVETAYKQKLSWGMIDHRYRMEFRNFHNINSDNTGLDRGYRFTNFRFRYRFQVTLPLVKSTNDRGLKFKISNELFVNLGKKVGINVFDQNRFFTGFSYDILKNLTFESGYMNLFQEKSNGNFYNRNILRLTVFHTIDLKGKKRPEDPLQK